MSKKVQSEVAGTVWEVSVSAGQSVDAGDTLVIVESMKMELPVESPAAGKVVEIRVKQGDLIAEGQIVAIVE